MGALVFFLKNNTNIRIFAPTHRSLYMLTPSSTRRQKEKVKKQSTHKDIPLNRKRKNRKEEEKKNEPPTVIKDDPYFTPYHSRNATKEPKNYIHLKYKRKTVKIIKTYY